jgi:hypothetical protein
MCAECVVTGRHGAFGFCKLPHIHALPKGFRRGCPVEKSHRSDHLYLSKIADGIQIGFRV